MGRVLRRLVAGDAHLSESPGPCGGCVAQWGGEFQGRPADNTNQSDRDDSAREDKGVGYRALYQVTNHAFDSTYYQEVTFDGPSRLRLRLGFYPDHLWRDEEVIAEQEQRHYSHDRSLLEIRRIGTELPEWFPEAPRSDLASRLEHLFVFNSGRHTWSDIEDLIAQGVVRVIGEDDWQGHATRGITTSGAAGGIGTLNYEA